MKKLIEEVISEDWKRGLATGVTAAALAFGAPAINADAKAHKAHHGLEHRTYSEQDIINSIAGEQSNNYQGMLAVASAIRNKMKHPYYRNNILHGVAGRTAKHLKGESPRTFELARKAWEESAYTDTTDGAYLWGYGPDVLKWTQQARENPKFWFNNVEPTVTVGGNTFFRDKRT